MWGSFAVFQGYQKRWFIKDLLAGLTVAAVTTPVGMGYAQIAGLPPVYGLYASVLPAVIYVLFASSKRIIFGTDAVIASMVAAITVNIAASEPEKLPAVATMLAIITGAFFLLFGLLKLGGLARYFSKPTMSGFIAGLALTILVAQLPKMLDLAVDADDTIATLIETARHISGANVTSVVMVVTAILALLISKKVWPRFPTAVVILIIFTLLTAGLDLAERNVGIVGEVPSGVPGFGLPGISWDMMEALLPGGLAISVVVFADSLLTARSFAVRRKDSFDDNKELRGIGIANLIGGLFGAMPGSASASRAAAAEAAGMRTQVTQIFAAVFIALVLLAGSKLLFYMPTAVLATVVFLAVATLFDVRLLGHFFRVRRHDFWIMLVTTTAVIVIGVLPAVLLSVFLSVTDFFLRSTRPPDALLGRIPGKRGYYDLANHKKAKPVPGVAIYRFGAPLIFSNHDQFERKVLRLADDKQTKAIIISGEAITDIDSTAADGLRDLVEKLKTQKVPLDIAGLIESTRVQLDTYGIGLPKECIHKTIDGTVKAIRKQGIIS